jgi:hypothetical protein
MDKPLKKIITVAKMCSVALIVAAATVGTARTSSEPTDQANAKRLVKAMSDYLASQRDISFDFETNLEIVTKENQKLGLASTGSVTLERPGKIRATRKGGFANVEFVSDGKTMTFVGKDKNVYAQVEAPATIDQLVDVLRDKYHRPVPAADLLMSNVYDQLMPEVVDAKDLGTGVIGGVECDHLAFRTKDVDWQIWITQGDRPRPCRYVITSSQVAGAPQYTIDITSWKTGTTAETTTTAVAKPFRPTIPANASKLDLDELKDFDDLPAIFAMAKEKRGQ